MLSKSYTIWFIIHRTLDEITLLQLVLVIYLLSIVYYIIITSTIYEIIFSLLLSLYSYHNILFVYN